MSGFTRIVLFGCVAGLGFTYQALAQTPLSQPALAPAVTPATPTLTSEQTISTSPAASITASSTIDCCSAQLSSLKPTPLQVKPTVVNLDATAPTQNFGSGAQAYLLLQLLAYTTPYEITIDDIPQKETRIEPNILTLDAQGKVLRRYTPDKMTLHGSGLGKTVFINPNNANERYILVYGALRGDGLEQTHSTSNQTYIGTGFWFSGSDTKIKRLPSDKGQLAISVKGLPEPEKK